MSQLLNENLRLQQQLQTLRTSESSAPLVDERQEIEALQRSMNYTLSPHPLYNTQQQPQTQQVRSPPPVQQQHQEGLAQQTASQTQALKYVCCGNCRQWLSAPREATYVYCPGCEAVNNCAIAPPPAPSSQTERAPPRVYVSLSLSSSPPPHPSPRLDAQPWYLQCFARVLG
jgi:LSD1 subclass zinc finger protein